MAVNQVKSCTKYSTSVLVPLLAPETAHGLQSSMYFTDFRLKNEIFRSFHINCLFWYTEENPI